MNEIHPNDIELLEFAEGDLDEAKAATLHAHVDDCQECLDSLRLMAGGREALRETPLLELPPERLVTTLASLGVQEARERSAWLRPRRALAVLAPVTAIVALVAIVSTLDVGTEGSHDAAAPAEVQTLQAEAPSDAPAGREDEAGLGEAAPESARSTESFEAAPAEPAREPAAEPAPEPAAKPTEAPEEAADGSGDASAPTNGTSATKPAEDPAEAPPAESVPEEPVAAPAPDLPTLRAVDGTEDEVLALLQSAGLEAAPRKDGSIVVAAPDERAVLDALAQLADGDLLIVLDDE